MYMYEVLQNSTKLVPKNAPEALSGSLKCKNFLGEHAPRPARDSVVIHINDLDPLFSHLLDFPPPYPPTPLSI